MINQLPNSVTNPSWWQLIKWIADPIGFQQKYSQKYGDIFSVNLSVIGSFVIIGHPQAIQEIFIQDSKFDIGRGNQLAKPHLGQNSLMLMDGSRHRRERKLLMPPFHEEKLQTYAQQICSITKQIVSQWQISQPFLARSAMQKVSLEVILLIVFGLSEGERYQQLKLLLPSWLDMIDSPLRSSMVFLPFLQQDWGRWTPWGQMKHRRRCIHQLLQAEIAEKRTKKDKNQSDVLSLMMAARDENGQAMTDEEIKDELLTILFTGHETTATMLAWALYELHRNSDVLEKLLQELYKLGENPNPMEISRLPYLTAVCQETLRMYPVIPIIFPRITKSSINIAGYQFEPETTLMPSIYLVHYREDLYPHPYQFKPERFLERQYSPSEYFPFGGGSRRCLGYALALLEMKLVLATVLSNYQLALVKNRPIRMQRRGLTLTPNGGVPMVITGKR
ncbi:cytochrome P450 [Nostoc sphaeroides CHAB 2801]|uniref:cytochrome P450 n=1 Tax=Nostoc sphaeroides TaxID=446679 RepID=UPI000E5473F2|nr:cytochrome P450 [Nostoc sphaeroides]MCC5634211.1 cytochrome P450 [Nostoc sphaeroides CHAB 2801]